MPLPATAVAFPQELGPWDLVDFYPVISQGSPEAQPATVLLLGEAIAEYSLALTPEAAAVGLLIVDREGYRNRLIGNVLKVWFEVDPSMRRSAIFYGAGITVAIEINIKTTNDPPRFKQISFLMRIAKK